MHQEILDVCSYFRRSCPRVVSHKGFPALADQELLPIPPDIAVLLWLVKETVCVGEVITSSWTRRLKKLNLILNFNPKWPLALNRLRPTLPYLQIGVEWVFILSIHFDFVEEQKIGLESTSWTDVPDAVVDFSAVGAWLLLQESRVLEGIRRLSWFQSSVISYRFNFFLPCKKLVRYERGGANTKVQLLFFYFFRNWQLFNLLYKFLFPPFFLSMFCAGP